MKKRIPKFVDYSGLNKDAKLLATVLENLDWHSTIGKFTQTRIITRILNNEPNRALFLRLGEWIIPGRRKHLKGRLFIHKENKSLWMITKNQKYLVAVFPNDGIEVEIEN